MTNFFSNKILMRAGLLSGLLFVLMIGLFAVGSKSAQAGTDPFDFGSYQCSRHGSGDQKYCPQISSFFGSRTDYTNASANVTIKGHRHGGSYINATTCLLDYAAGSGSCIPAYHCDGAACGQEWGNNHPWTPLYTTTLTANASGDGTQGFYITRTAGVEDAEVQVIVTGSASYEDPVDPPTTPTAGVMNFHVHANCSAENIPGATITLSGGATGTATTNSSGNVDFSVPTSTVINWSASASGYSSNSGSANSGASGATVDVTLNRDCYSPPPPEVPPEAPPIPACTAADNATLSFITPPPATMVANQVYSFVVRSQDTGNTRWYKYYNNSGYRLDQLSSLDIISTSPESGYPFGHILSEMWPNEIQNYTFSITAPAVAGNYSLSMRMTHEGVINPDPTVQLWGYRKVDGSNGNCPIPATTFGFGNTVTANFAVTAAPSPTGTISATSCTIPVNFGNCNSTVTWNTSNPIPGAATSVTHNNPNNTSVSTDTGGTGQLFPINNGSTTFYLNHNGATLATSSVVTAACAAGSHWNVPTLTCVSDSPTPPTGTLTAGFNPCTIAKSGSTCGVSFSWTTSNIPGGQTPAITKTPDTTVATGASGSQSLTVKYPEETFNLWSSLDSGNRVLLDQESAMATCGEGLEFDYATNHCVAAVCHDPAANNFNGDLPCTYDPGQGGCPVGNVSLSAYTINLGQSVVASAPAGFSGGTFISNNPTIASTSGNVVTSRSYGTALISGKNWNYAGGATGCILGGTGTTTTCPAGYTYSAGTCVGPTSCSPYTGTYPNCTGTGGSCAAPYTGFYPSCIGPNACPAGYHGAYPNCINDSGAGLTVRRIPVIIEN